MHVVLCGGSVMGFAAWLEDVGDTERAKAFDALRSEIGVAWVTV
jgi:hypothetical protein